MRRWSSTIGGCPIVRMLASDGCRLSPGPSPPRECFRVRPSRPLPSVGMAVRIVYLGAIEEAVIGEVCDEGRTLVVGCERFTLRRVTGRFVREGEPSHGTRLAFAPE